MPYYMKVAFGQKIKKYIVRNPKHINLHQIRHSFVPPIISAHLSYQLEQPHQKQRPRYFKSQSALSEHLQKQQYGDKQVIKLRIYNTSTQNNDEDDEEEILLPGMSRLKSKSEQIKVGKRTNEFSVEGLQITQQFLFQSLTENMQKKQEASLMLKNADNKLKKLQQESNKTDIKKLLDFLGSK